MEQNLSSNQKRIESIDVLRGLVMVIMALDHVRDYFHIGANVSDPLDLQSTSPLLFFTRYITHFCAPIFVFLTGLSIYLQSLRKTKKELSRFLILRGLWLIIVEIFIISFAWSFNPHYHYIFLQVIWAIGISMLLLGLMIRLPFNALLFLGLVIVCGHNLLDRIESTPGFKPGFLFDLLHSARFSAHSYSSTRSVFIAYPFLPWTGLMLLGYCAGRLYGSEFSSSQRIKYLRRSGFGLILFFIILRGSNFYGDPETWSIQNNLWLSFLSFIKVNKYPPSLLFMLITIGPALLLLSFFEKLNNSFTNSMRIFGKVAFFYYILHLYFIHLFAVLVFFMRGHTLQDASITGDRFPFYFVVPGEGFGLMLVYGIWIILVISLYPLCKWYNNYKSKHPEKWWLSYL